MVGDETIGYGSTLEINDGGAGSFVEVGKIVTWNDPSTTTGMAESKRLDLDNATIRRIPTLLTPGDVSMTLQNTKAGYDRLRTHRDARTELQFRFTVVDDDGNDQETKYGIVTNLTRPVTADEITTFDVTIALTGRAVA